jgi:membrane dipeptidase
MGTRYCGGTSEPGPLTDLGRRLLDRMARHRMVLDTSHMAEDAFFDAIDRYQGPVIASHSNPRRFVDGDRHLSDDMIRALIARDGVIGHVPFNAFLVPGWRRSEGAPKDAADLSTIVRAIDHICDLAGNARHVGLGSDLDGGFGAEATPAGIDSVADLQKVVEALSDRGYADAEVAGIAHGNWLRVLRMSLPGTPRTT